MDTIEFEGKSYPIKNIKMPFGERTISIDELNEKIINSDGSYVSEKARLIDEDIFYYIERKCFNLPETELVAQINSEI
ncbi:MAG: hypothetical protein H0X63_09805 [Flavobacteriales bacterium]|jgi:hypothetical protein|nr:hypothetical protein [Flavobacteriales bacterium]